MTRLILLTLLLLTSNAVGQTATTEPWRSTDVTAAADFHVMLSPGVAPAVVHVNAVDCPLPVGTPLTARYDWDFGDAAGKYNTLTGFNAAHVYDSPGRYTITLTVTGEDGTVRKTTAKVSISPNGRKQLFVSPGGSDRNVGTSEDTPLATLEQAFKDLTDGCEIRLRAGVTFNVDETLQIRKSDVLIGRYGEGPDPVLMLEKVDGTPTAKGHHGMVAMDNRCNGVLVERITVDTPYGVADTAEAPKVGIDAFIVRGRNITFREMTFLNVDTAINSNGNPTGLLVQDCRAPKPVALRAYLVWGQGTDHVYIGNTVANSTREHCVRLSSVDRVLIYGNDFTNLDRQSVDKYDASKGTIEMHRGSYAWIAGNTVHDGTIRVGPLGLHGEEDSSATDWAVIENNRVIDTEIFAVAGAHHVMMRNNLIFTSDRNGFDINGTAGPRTSGDLTIINNTVVNNGKKGSFLVVGGHVDGITLKNNLYVIKGVPGTGGPGTGGPAAIYDAAGDLTDFKSVAHNVWPATAGDLFYVNKKVTPIDQWKAMSNVSNDSFADVTVDDDGAPTTNPAALSVGEAHPAVRFDRQGKPRPTGPTTVGAVEIGGNKNR